MHRWLRFFAFWADITVRRMPLFLLRAVKQVDLLYGAVPLLLGVGAAAYLNLISVWSALAVLLVLGLMWAVYEKWEETNDRKEELEAKLATAAQRKAVKELLGACSTEGEKLRKWSYVEDGERIIVSQADVEDWVHRTRDLLEAAFDKAEAQRFVSNRGYTEEELGYRPNARLKPRNLDSPYLTAARLKRIDELVARMHLLDISPDFDPQDWAS